MSNEHLMPEQDPLLSLHKSMLNKEWITVIYAGGSAQGYKRKILVKKIEASKAFVLEAGLRRSTTTRTYLISNTTIVDDAFPVPWMPDNAGDFTVVQPEKHFSGWVWEIKDRPELWSALGVARRFVLDRQATKKARDLASVNGLSYETALKIKIGKMQWTTGSPVKFEFHESDIFYRGIHGGSDWLFIAATRFDVYRNIIEVHLPDGDGRRRAYAMDDIELANMLQNGSAPPEEKRVLSSSSTVETIRLLVR